MTPIAISILVWELCPIEDSCSDIDVCFACPSQHFCCRFASLLQSLGAMLSKRSLPSSYSDAPREKRFRANMSDLFLTNALSASRVASLLDDAEVSDIHHALHRCAD